MKLIWRLTKDRMKDNLILFLTVGIGLLLCPAKFYSLHSEN